MPVQDRKRLVGLDGGLTISTQCDLLGLSRSGFYYNPVDVNPFDLEIMTLIDEIFTAYPFYGSRRIREELKDFGHFVNRKKIQRLMVLMGLEAIYPKRNLSKAHHAHRIYPYLLRGVKIVRPCQVWSTDITFIRLQRGYVYLVAVIDWWSRYVLSWRLSNTLDASFCCEALEEALAAYPHPEIFNSDQGCQFTSNDFTGILTRENISISMDSVGRALDNVFIERLWRSLKYEEVYLNSYENVKEAFEGIKNYFYFFNSERKHQSLVYRTPSEVFMSSKKLRRFGS